MDRLARTIAGALCRVNCAGRYGFRWYDFVLPRRVVADPCPPRSCVALEAWQEEAEAVVEALRENHYVVIDQTLTLEYNDETCPRDLPSSTREI